MEKFDFIHAGEIPFYISKSEIEIDDVNLFCFHLKESNVIFV